jgi:hypothetical protein
MLREWGGSTLQVIYLFAPMIPALLASGVVLRFDLFRALRRPIDGGATIRGRRVFGDSKTWRGVIVAIAGCIFGAAVQKYFVGDRAGALALVDYGGINVFAFGAAMGGGAMLGELPNSLVKRRLFEHAEDEKAEVRDAREKKPLRSLDESVRLHLGAEVEVVDPPIEQQVLQRRREELHGLVRSQDRAASDLIEKGVESGLEVAWAVEVLRRVDDAAACGDEAFAGVEEQDERIDVRIRATGLERRELSPRVVREVTDQVEVETRPRWCAHGCPYDCGRNGVQAPSRRSARRRLAVGYRAKRRAPTKPQRRESPGRGAKRCGATKSQEEAERRLRGNGRRRRAAPLPAIALGPVDPTPREKRYR